MAFYATYTNASSSPSPPRSYARHHIAVSQPSSPASMVVDWDDAADYLSSDLDISFASTMSINSAPSSPTQVQSMIGGGRTLDPFSLAPPPPSERMAMDISPAVAPPANQHLSVPRKAAGGPRFTSSPNVDRPFGVEVSNVNVPQHQLTSSPLANDSPIKAHVATRPRSRTTAGGLPPLRGPSFMERSITQMSGSQKSSKGSVTKKSTPENNGTLNGSGRARAALPGAWLQVPSTQAAPTSARSKRNGTLFSAKPVLPSSPHTDVSMMDIDHSMHSTHSPAVSMASVSSAGFPFEDVPASPPRSKAAELPPLIPTSPDVPSNSQLDFSGLFYHSSSPDVHASPSLASAMMGRAWSAQSATTTGSNGSNPSSVGGGSKKRRSHEFDEDDDSEDATARISMNKNGPAQMFNGALSSSPPPSSPTAPHEARRRSKSRCIERASTLGGGLLGIGNGFPPRSSLDSPADGSPAPLSGGSGSLLFAARPLQSTQSMSVANQNTLTRRALPKRPALAGLGHVHSVSSGSTSSGTSSRVVSSTAALPFTASGRPAPVAPPTRRAFSACVPKNQQLGFGQQKPTMMMMDSMDSVGDDDASSDFELSMDSFGHEIASGGLVSAGPLGSSGKIRVNFDHANSPAQRAHLARRENIARFGNRHSAQARMGPSPKRGGCDEGVARSLPGFGDSEADGKVLPCHKVREDGLMRISASTLDDLINGVYDDDIASYTVIDCRFDYEHLGGHIPGAINLNTNEAIESALLDPNSEDALFGKPPAPSRSGDGAGRKRVLVFHCEFSAKRAPTFAKHMRSKDRSMNGHNYPNIHYPEVYILEGGYSAYFTQFADRCEPPAYVRMDDPAHQRARASELNDFRRWNRTRSFTYGELQRASAGVASGSATSGAQASSARPVSTDSHMLGGNGSTQAGGAGRRPPLSTLQTLTEDGDSSFASEPDASDSPCPPAGSRIAPLMMSSMATGGMKPRGMQRALTTALIGARH